MTREYRPRTFAHLSFKTNNCKAGFSTVDGNYRQCGRTIWKDGWCKQHHPDTVAKRRAERKLRYQQKTERSLGFLLEKSREEVARLKARIAELEAEREQT